MLILATLMYTAALHAGSMADSILIGDNYRSFYFETNKQKAGASLVFVLHGSGGSGLQMQEATRQLAVKQDQENFILVFPNGYKRYWNECRKMANSKANEENIDEESFFIAMIDYFQAKHGIDPKKVFVMGTSGGGHMAYKLAMSIPERIKAITAIIASLPTDDNMDCAHAKKAIPVMIVNGTDDPLNKYEGGMMQSGTFKMGTVRSTDQTFRYWSQLAGYNGQPSVSRVPDKDSHDGKTIMRYTYKQAGKPEIVLLKVIGGKHDYPNDIDVHVEGWDFFKRQP